MDLAGQDPRRCFRGPEVVENRTGGRERPEALNPLPMARLAAENQIPAGHDVLWMGADQQRREVAGGDLQDVDWMAREILTKAARVDRSFSGDDDHAASRDQWWIDRRET